MLEHFPVENVIEQIFANHNKSFKNMKKRLNQSGLYKPLLKFDLKMKLTTLLLITTLFGLYANDSNAQKTKVTLNVEDVSVRKIIDKIESSTDFKFIYKTKDVDLEHKISLRAKNEYIEKVLKSLFSNTNTVFKVRGTHITLKRNQEKVLSVKGNLKVDVTKKSQGLPVTGLITDEDGNPLPGANIVEKGTTNGVTADFDGNFSIDVTDGNATLVVSYIGFATKEASINGQSTLNISLEESAAGLEEVVVVGYGTQRKIDVTGAVSTVKADDLDMVAKPSVAQMLAGKAAGVNVVQNSAQPGGGLTILIRGATSTGAGNDPLYVVDGFPLGGGGAEPGNTTRYEYGSRNPLNSINPYDIESIENLKDASATAIYGARAANGVILITTKKGKKGEAKVTYNTNYTVQKISKKLDMLNATEFMQETNKTLYEEWLYLNRVAPYGNTNPDEISSPYLAKYTDAQIAHAGVGTDWWDLITREGAIKQHNISVTGGNEKTLYALTGNYFDQQGVVKNSDFKRYSVRSNIEQKLGDKIKTGINLTLSQINNSNVALGDRLYENAGLLSTALTTPGTVPVRNPNGEYAINPDYGSSPNPVSLLEIDDQTVTKRILGTVFLEAQLSDAFIFRTNLGIDNQIGTRNTYLPKTTLYGAQVGGDASRSQTDTFDKLLNATLGYKEEFFDDHRVDLLLGYEYQQFNSEGFSARSTGFFTDSFLSNSLGTGEVTTPQYLNSNKSRNELASYFGRLNYSFKDKYYLTFTGRIDGSTKFGVNNKYAFFPSGAISWRLTEEDFIKDLNTFSNLKLRVTYGDSGNQNIGQNSLAFYNSSYAGFVFGNTLQTGTYLSQIENPNLKWETTTQFNVGLDIGLLKDRISISMEYYDKVVKDLLDFRKLPSFSVVEYVADNIGKTQSKGFEFTLRSLNTPQNELKWNTDLTFTTYKDKWKERNPDVTLAPYETVDDPLRPIFGYQGDGLLEIGEAPPEYMPDLMPGQDKIKDLNGVDENGNLTGEPDGKITSADQVLLGTYDPSIIVGLGNTFRYKKFDLNFSLYGMFGRKLINQNWGTWGIYNLRSIFTGQNMMSDVKERWTHENTDATMASGMIDVYEKPSLLEDASFLRCKNITLGYTLPEIKNGYKNLRLYLDVQNPFVITNYSGLDPETDSRAGYPNQISYSIGLDVTF